MRGGREQRVAWARRKWHGRLAGDPDHALRIASLGRVSRGYAATTSRERKVTPGQLVDAESARQASSGRRGTPGPSPLLLNGLQPLPGILLGGLELVAHPFHLTISGVARRSRGSRRGLRSRPGTSAGLHLVCFTHRGRSSFLKDSPSAAHQLSGHSQDYGHDECCHRSVHQPSLASDDCCLPFDVSHMKLDRCQREAVVVRLSDGVELELE